MQTANRLLTNSHGSPEQLAIKVKEITNNFLFKKKRKHCFLSARLLNCKILVPQNTFKAKSTKAFMK